MTTQKPYVSHSMLDLVKLAMSMYLSPGYPSHAKMIRNYAGMPVQHSVCYAEELLVKKGGNPMAERTITFQSDSNRRSLGELEDVLVQVYGFSLSHAHEFLYDGRGDGMCIFQRQTRDGRHNGVDMVITEILESEHHHE